MTTTAERPDRPESIFSHRFRTTTLGIVVLMTLIAFEAMAAAPALPTAARDLHGISAYGWAFTGFFIANVVGMVLAAQLADARGPRVPLLVGLVAFFAGLVVSGSAETMAQLVAGRVVQGLGGGLLITALYVVLGNTYPKPIQPKVFALLASAWVVPSLLGPVVSGGLTESVGWRWVFLGLLPFVALGGALLIPALRHLRPHLNPQPADPMRTLRAIAVAIGVAALENGGQHPSALSITLAALGLGAVIWGLRRLLPRGTVRLAHGVAAPIALRGVLAGAFFGVESTVPLSLSQLHHYGPTEAGLPLACAGVFWAMGSWWQGHIRPDQEQARRVPTIRVGFGLAVVAALLVAWSVQPNGPGWIVYVAWACAGTGAGMAMTSASVLMMRYTTDADRSNDSAALQLSDTTASAITTGFAGVLVAAAARAAITYSTAFTILDVTMAAIALIGVVGAGRVRRPDPMAAAHRADPARTAKV